MREMSIIQLFFILIGFALLVRNVEGAGSDKSKLKDLCGAVLELKAVYNRDCEAQKAPTTPTIVDQAAPEKALCAVIASRFASTDDIKETDQTADLKRHLTRIEHEDFCLQGANDDHIQAVLSHLERAITYFGDLKSQHVNTALVGTRTTQAQLALYFEHWQETDSTSTWPPTPLLARLKTLALQAKDASWMIEKTNGNTWGIADKKEASSFYRKMPLRNSWKDWEILASKEVHLAPQFKNLTHYHLDHELNIECYHNMTQDCGLTQECADILIDQSAVLTTLGHNLLFFQTAIRMECVQEVDFGEKFPNGDWQSVLEHHCSAMWNEANVISNADFPIGYKGLFLLHASMCASTGYPNFLRADWMTHVMSWMSTAVNGCIPPDTKPGSAPDSELVERGFDDLADNGEWCSIYETSRAVQVLSLHLRYLLESCPSE